ncbi:MAG: hypothetical protein QOE96_4202 [Blastocatellia bacterium]|nr:hypothetical protein [Blastocatellia bacterium]
MNQQTVQASAAFLLRPAATARRIFRTISRLQFGSTYKEPKEHLLPRLAD